MTVERGRRDADEPSPWSERRPAAGSETRPAGMTVGGGHVVVYGNPAFRAMFGERSIGIPARESMVHLPAEAFALLDAVLETGRPLARWIQCDGRDWRLTAIARRDADTETVYGVAFHLRAREDLPVVRR